MEEKLQDLKQRLSEIHDLEMANAVLGWDQLTYMPPGGAEARGRQMATLARLAQEKMTDPGLGKLIEELLPYADSLPEDHDDAALIRVAKRDFDRLTKIPPQLIARVYEHQSRCYMAWTEARPNNDFEKVRPLLEQTLEYSREVANCFPGYEHIADPLIDWADYGMKAKTLRVLFDQLRQELVPLVQAITSYPPSDDSCLRQHFPEKDQIAFGEQVIRALGYDFQRGRQDKSPHPFTTRFGYGDVRITTRVKENDFGEAFFSTVHEAGHAMYEQGCNPAFDGTPLFGGTSAGVHESQSRLWENVVARSREFWEYYYPLLQKTFPGQLGNVTLDTFYRAINKVQPSLVRTDADEVTYNLHVMIRFDLELQMLEGSLEVKHLPEAWNERYRSDLGVVPPDDRDGCLQDVHWYGGFIGGQFQGYTLGNILSALFYHHAVLEIPSIPEEIRQGKFENLHGWLKEHIYQHGRKYTAPDLIRRVTGRDLDIQPYIAYLKRKYGELYSL